MAITHISAVKVELANVVRTRVDAGAAGGRLIIYPATIPAVHTATSGLANLLMNDTAFATPNATSGSMTMNTTPAVQDTNAAQTGTAAAFVITDSAYNEVLRGTVKLLGAAGDGDIELSRVTITTGDTVSMTSLTYNPSV